MKKIVAIVAIVLVAIVGISYFVLVSQYEKEKVLYDFLVPKGAEMQYQEENHSDDITFNHMGFEWSKATDYSSFPLGYKIALLLNGWKETSTQNLDEISVFYFTKDNAEITISISDGKMIIYLRKNDQDGN